MTLTLYKALAALLIFLASAASIIYPLRKRHALKQTEPMQLGEAFASGIFLGAAFFHMLPSSIELFGEVYGAFSYPIPELVCVLGFLFVLFLERCSLNPATIKPNQTIPYFIAVMLAVHALTEGAALGISSTYSEAIMLSVAILAHKSSESFALCVILIKEQINFERILLMILLLSLMTPIGVGVGEGIHSMLADRSGQLLAAYFNAFAAGMFLYIASLHHIHFHQHLKDSHGMVEFFSLVSGVVLMALIAGWA